MLKSEYFLGLKLYGDDFNSSQIEEWVKEEAEGYSGLYLKNKNQKYCYHELNKIHGYNLLPPLKNFFRTLCFGGANGEEILPILDKVKKIIIIEPSNKLRLKTVGGKEMEYLSPQFSGKLNVADNSIDLITCFGTLHHIPNVSFVFGELVRVLKRGGILMIREPIVSMGDWMLPRKGLTKRERGIPLNIFRKSIKQNNLRIISESKIMFPLMNRLNNFNSKGKGVSQFSVKIDVFLSKIFSWNYRYHSTKIWHKFQPNAVFYVLEKPFETNKKEQAISHGNNQKH